VNSDPEYVPRLNSVIPCQINQKLAIVHHTPRIFLKFVVHKLHAKLVIKVKISAGYFKIWPRY